MATTNNDGNKSTRHHIIPRSRGGSNGSNIIIIPRRIHEAYHVFFGNLTPDEAIEFIQIVFQGKGRKRIKKNWKIEEINNLQLKIQQQTYRKEKMRKKKKNEEKI